jgi:hypothetical protein
MRTWKNHTWCPFQHKHMKEKVTRKELDAFCFTSRCSIRESLVEWCMRARRHPAGTPGGRHECRSCLVRMMHVEMHKQPTGDLPRHVEMQTFGEKLQLVFFFNSEAAACCVLFSREAARFHLGCRARSEQGGCTLQDARLKIPPMVSWGDVIVRIY